MKNIIISILLAVILPALPVQAEVTEAVLKTPDMTVEYLILNNAAHNPAIAIKKIIFKNGDEYKINEAEITNLNLYFTNASAGITMTDLKNNYSAPVFEDYYFRLIFYMAEQAVCSKANGKKP